LIKNIGLIAKRGFTEQNAAPCYTSKFILDRRGWSRPGMQGAESLFPLYIYPETNEQQTFDETKERNPNLDKEIVSQIAKALKLTFTPEKEKQKTPLPQLTF